jgi:hypothetical protein
MNTPSSCRRLQRVVCRNILLLSIINRDLIIQKFKAQAYKNRILYSLIKNLNSNPYINQIKTRIKSFLSNNPVKHELSSYIIERIERDPSELASELNLSSKKYFLGAAG